MSPARRSRHGFENPASTWRSISPYASEGAMRKRPLSSNFVLSCRARIRESRCGIHR